MNPIKFQARALRRLCLTAYRDPGTRPHLCALRFRRSDVVATNGHMLVRAPLPSDPERDFVLPSVPLANLIGKRLRRVVTIMRGERETRIAIEGGETFILLDNPEISVDRFPRVEHVIDDAQDAGGIRDINLSARVWTQIGKLARDLYPYEPLEDDDDNCGRQPDDAPVTILKAGRLHPPAPAHITCKSHHGDALIVAMPVKP
jgi:hypothetical protein